MNLGSCGFHTYTILVFLDQLAYLTITLKMSAWKKIPLKHASVPTVFAAYDALGRAAINCRPDAAC